MTDKGLMGLIGAGIALVVLAVVAVTAVDIVVVEGNQVGVKETWSGGVVDTVFPSKTYIFPGVTQKMFKYDMTPHIYVMNNRDNDERANGRKNDAYIAKSSDNQTMTLDLALQWHYDPAKIIDIHKRYKTHTAVRDWENVIEERVIRQNLMGAVNTAATARTAIFAYSGPGFIEMQSEIFNKLTAPDGELREQGIIVENFVIEKVTLDQEYISQINGRQVAQQKTLRAQEEEKAALAEANRAKAEAQADYERRVVEAERDKQVQVLASEGLAQQSVNAAKAEAEKVVLAANAEREAAEARAAAILALGTAEAESKRLQLSAYAVPGAEAFVQIEVAKSMADAFSGIKGYLPENMQVHLLSDNFLKSVTNLLGGSTTSK